MQSLTQETCVDFGVTDHVQWGSLGSTCKFGRQHAQLGFRDANFMVQPVKVGLQMLTAGVVVE